MPIHRSETNQSNLQTLETCRSHAERPGIRIVSTQCQITSVRHCKTHDAVSLCQIQGIEIFHAHHTEWKMFMHMYKGTSLIRDSPPPPTVGSWGEAVSYERGTPVMDSDSAIRFKSDGELRKQSIYQRPFMCFKGICLSQSVSTGVPV